MLSSARAFRTPPIVLLAVALIAGVALGLASPVRADAATSVASDSFDRSVASGWGSASTGGAWTVVGGSATTVTNSAGVVRGVQPGRSLRARLDATRALDVVVKADFTIPAPSEFYYHIEARRAADGSVYSGRVRVDRSRVLHSEIYRTRGGQNALLDEQTTSYRVQTGQIFRVELVVSGTSAVSLRSRTYPTGSTSLPGWQTETTDSSGSRIASAGSVGLQAYVASTSVVSTNRVTDVLTQAFESSATDTGSPPPAPAPPPDPAPVPPSPPSAGSYGAAAVGSTSYPVPANAVFVSATSGNDANAGTQAAPVKTVTRAIAKSKAGGTIVMRAGRYHESFLVPPQTPVTIQSYPKEAAWFDGSRAVTGFVPSGSAWRADGWTAKFDSSPTYVKGAPDGTAVGWQWINPKYPLASRPDQVWIDGVEQTQVGSLGAVTSGTFFADYASNRLYLGSNPSGKLVEASDLSTAISLRAPGTVIRGVGVRRYANSVYQQGVITSYYPNMTLENVEVRDSATAGIGIYKPGSKLIKVSIVGSGQMGLQTQYADGLVLDNVSVRNSNDQHFNPTPAAGGIKLTMTRGMIIKNSQITGTDGNAFWADQSNYDMTVVNNAIQNNNRWGVVMEISSTATIADNLITGNAHEGVLIANSDKMNIWNNTIVGNRGAISVTQDSRRITQLSVAGHDPRRPQPDTSMPWISRDVVLGNNLLNAGPSGTSILQVVSWERVFTGNQMVTSSNGNMFTQTNAGQPAALASWGRSGNYPVSYATLADYVKATGRDTSSRSLIGSTGVDGNYRLTSAVAAQVSAVAQPLPSAVATKVGVAAGSRQIGAWL